jgi:hypothetical protein
LISSSPPWMPVLAFAAAMAASEQKGTPASLPTTPGGSLIEKRVNSCSESVLKRRTLKGEKRPAALLMLPAIRPGLKGGRPPEGQAPPSGPLSIWKEPVVSIASASLEAENGVNLAVVLYSPQAGGVASGALAPSRKCSLKELYGIGGRLSKVVVIWPFDWLKSTLPACLTSTPRSGALATR